MEIDNKDYITIKRDKYIEILETAIRRFDEKDILESELRTLDFRVAKALDYINTYKDAPVVKSYGSTLKELKNILEGVEEND